MCWSSAKGYVEGQMREFVIRKVKLERGHKPETLMKVSVREITVYKNVRSFLCAVCLTVAVVIVSYLKWYNEGYTVPCTIQ